MLLLNLWQLISFEYSEIQEALRSSPKKETAKILQEKEITYKKISVNDGQEKKDPFAAKTHYGTDLKHPSKTLYSNTIINKNNVAPDNNMFFESVKSMLKMGIEDDFPELNLSENEFRDLTKAVISIKESMQGLRSLERNGENAKSIIKIQDRLNDAAIKFERITDMSLTTFMLRASVTGGIDNDKPHDKDIVFEYLDDHRK